MKTDKILFIVNPVAGRMRSRTAMFDIVNAFCKQGHTVTTVVTQKRGHGSRLAAEAAAQGYDMIVCCGGDGTLNEVISGMMGSGNPLPLGYIPAGSTNDFAETLGISVFPEVAAERIAQKKDFINIDIGNFNDERYFSYIASFGAFAAASYEAPQELKNTLGHFAYILEGIRDLGEVRSHRVHVEADGRLYSGNYLFCSVSNTSSIAGMVKLKPSVFDITDGLFEVLLVKKPYTVTELNEIIFGITNSNFSSRVFEFFKTRDIRFALSKNIPWTLDGEKAEGRPTIHIKTLPSAIKLYK